MKEKAEVHLVAPEDGALGTVTDTDGGQLTTAAKGLASQPGAPDDEAVEGVMMPRKPADDQNVLVELREEARRHGRLLGTANQPNVILTPPPNVKALGAAVLAGLRRQGLA